MVTYSAGGIPRAQTLESLVSDWQTYTPAWTTSGTQPAIGNGTITGRYKQMGDTGSVCWFNAGIEAGSTTTFGTGQWNISLPVAASQPGSPLNERYIGNYLVWDNSATLRYSGFVVLISASNVVGFGINSAIGVVAAVTATAPITFATSDRFTVEGYFEAG